MVLFVIVQQDPSVLMAMLAAVIVGREISISALREWMATIGQSTSVRVAWVGKVKTIAQMVSLTLLLYRHDFLGLPIYALGRWLLVVAAVLTLWSGFAYVRAAWPHMQDHSRRAS